MVVLCVIFRVLVVVKFTLPLARASDARNGFGSRVCSAHASLSVCAAAGRRPRAGKTNAPCVNPAELIAMQTFAGVFVCVLVFVCIQITHLALVCVWCLSDSLVLSLSLGLALARGANRAPALRHFPNRILCVCAFMLDSQCAVYLPTYSK